MDNMEPVVGDLIIAPTPRDGRYGVIKSIGGTGSNRFFVVEPLGTFKTPTAYFTNLTNVMDTFNIGDEVGIPLNTWFEIAGSDVMPVLGDTILQSDGFYGKIVYINAASSYIQIEIKSLGKISPAVISTTPHLWPANGSEVNLGDGSFGRRYTGNISMSGLPPNRMGQIFLSPGVNFTNWNITDYGGQIDYNQMSGKTPVGLYLSTTQYSNLYFSPQGNGIVLFANAATGTVNYDIWIRYTK